MEFGKQAEPSAHTHNPWVEQTKIVGRTNACVPTGLRPNVGKEPSGNSVPNGQKKNHMGGKTSDRGGKTKRPSA